MWSTETTDEFDEWFAALGQDEQEEIAAKVHLLKLMGPQLKRPHADTLNGSAHANMKELRAGTAAAVIRIAFAFDPLQKAILLVGGDKAGVSERRFYKQLILKADNLYDAHLKKIKKQKLEQEKDKDK
jgi:hypothetical protein